MEVKWTQSARQDLKEYYCNSNILSRDKLDEYVDKMLDYIESLNQNPRLGKLLFKANEISIRQVIYKKHRILYSISDYKIYILVICHVSRDSKNIMNFLKERLKDNHLF